MKLLVGNDFSGIERDENHPLMRFIDDNVTLDELNNKQERTLWERLEKENRIYNHVLVLNCLNFVEELTPDNPAEIKTIRRKLQNARMIIGSSTVHWKSFVLQWLSNRNRGLMNLSQK